MDEYIKREDLLRDMENEFQERIDWHRYTDIVKAQPAANVEPIIEAYWIRDYAIENNMADPGEVIARCTNCGWFALHDSYDRLLDYYNRCPHCGAHMKSAKEIIGDKEFEWYCK